MKDSDDQSGPLWLVFEWNEAKARTNAEKHGVEFEEARTIFNDTRLLTFEDLRHSEYERRYLSLGISARGRFLIAAHTEEDEVIRLITCRTATRKERRIYEQRR